MQTQRRRHTYVTTFLWRRTNFPRNFFVSWLLGLESNNFSVSVRVSDIKYFMTRTLDSEKIITFFFPLFCVDSWGKDDVLLQQIKALSSPFLGRQITYVEP